jgi:hypothetical protein
MPFGNSASRLHLQGARHRHHLRAPGQWLASSGFAAMPAMRDRSDLRAFALTRRLGKR